MLTHIGCAGVFFISVRRSEGRCPSLSTVAYDSRQHSPPVLCPGPHARKLASYALRYAFSFKFYNRLIVFSDNVECHSSIIQ